MSSACWCRSDCCSPPDPGPSIGRCGWRRSRSSRYSLPFREPYVTARGELRRAEADPGPDPRRGRSRAWARPRRSRCAAASASSRSPAEIRDRCWPGAAGRRGGAAAGSGRRSPAAATAAPRRRRWPPSTSPTRSGRARARASRSGGCWAPGGRPGRLQRDAAGRQPRGHPGDGGGMEGPRASGPSSSRSGWRVT